MISYQGYTPPPEFLAAIKRGEVAAVCLFAYDNVINPAQVRESMEMIYRAASEGGQLPPIIGIDQEGGQLIAITSGTTELPGNMALGATRSPELAEQAGRVLGRELLAMGINMNYAPSMDVNVNPANPVIGIRAFGDSPERVAELGVAMIRGLQAEGVIATAKHFPGHGDTSTDTHHGGVVVHHSLDRMNEIELLPFRAAIEANVGAVMSTHILFAVLDDQNPATISPAVLSGLLRQQMGFNGLIVTDAMDMYAVARFGTVESITRAIEAGADLIIPATGIPDHLGLVKRFAAMERPESVMRIQKAQRSLPTHLPPLEVVGCKEHQDIAQRIADHSITVVKNQRQIPLRPSEDETILVITPEPRDLTPADTSSRVQIQLAQFIRQRHPNTRALQLPSDASENDIADLLQAAEAASIVIVGTINADENQAALVRALYQRGKNPIVVALRTPYDLNAFPMIETYLCSYGIRPVSMKALTRVLWGEIEAQGVLPCNISPAAV